jgi:hypothetical protein
VSTLRTVVASTFLEGMKRLTTDEQALAKQTAFDLQYRPDHPSFQLHRLEGADPDFWSARANRDLRIRQRPGDLLRRPPRRRLRVGQAPQT